MSPTHPKIISYPTFKLYAKGDNEVSFFSGSKKTVDALVKFIESGGEEEDSEDDEDDEEEEISEGKDEL